MAEALSHAPVGQAAESALPSASDAPARWELSVFDLRTLRSSLVIDRSPDSASPALDFMAHGFITKTVKSPDVAVSVTTLNLLYRL